MNQSGAQTRAPVHLDTLSCRICQTVTEAGPYHVCEECFGPLEVVYDLEELRGTLTRETITDRPTDLWRYRELLPTAEEPSRGKGVGWTPLLPAPRLGNALGIPELWIKVDSSNHPTQSFKDRVVAVALQRAKEFGINVVGCASTGNLANSVAAQAATAGLSAWIFIPEDLEEEKIIATGVHGVRLVRIKGVYDDVNRLCAEVADRFDWGIVNVNLRAYYAEGSKTMGFEIAEQLGWTVPANIVAPMAGGSLIAKLRKAFRELTTVGLVAEGPEPRFFGAQATGCAPIISALESGADRIAPIREPATIARSLAIGNPADGIFAVETMRETGGWGAAVSDPEIVEGMRLLATLEGVFTETAGGVAVAAAAKLSKEGRIAKRGPTVLCITGNGLKTAEAARSTFELGEPIEPRLSEVERLADLQPNRGYEEGRRMSVTVRVPSALRKLTGGQSELTAEGTTVRELLDDLGRENPGLLERIMGDDGDIRQFLNVFVNGSDIRYEDDLDTKVSAGDEVSIVPSIAGGSGIEQ